MNNYKIIKCKECKKLFKLYSYQIYEGDPEYCPECNIYESNREDNRKRYEKYMIPDGVFRKK